MRVTTLKQRYVIRIEDKHLLLSACPLHFLPVLVHGLLKRFPIGIIGKHPRKGLPWMSLRLRIEFQLDHPPPSQERLQVGLHLAQDFGLALTFHDNHGPLADARNKFVRFSGY
jgi:hypothetical protein